MIQVLADRQILRSTAMKIFMPPFCFTKGQAPQVIAALNTASTKTAAGLSKTSRLIPILTVGKTCTALVLLWIHKERPTSPTSSTMQTTLENMKFTMLLTNLVLGS
ncbi:hypothetical protein [Bacillus sp. SORGH_AS_0510]|uniref:hypothetical protein n=1 Tax=Bacillus sp. SORGH_AS_0510 TaxID=3041771 RepID=UPI0027D7AC7A|nr:hypothetical protein [Bacillus sp. SORGH_AS_0510]